MGLKKNEPKQDEPKQIEAMQDERTLEEVFQELEQVISHMEEETSLEETFRLYHRGMDMLKLCDSKIDRVEKQMLILDEEGEAHEF